MQPLEQEIPLEAIPDRPKRRYTKRAAKWGRAKARKTAKATKAARKTKTAAQPIVKLTFVLDGKTMELDLRTARALHAILDEAFRVEPA